METRKELEQLARFMAPEALEEKVSLPIEFLPERVTHILPSIVVGGDGLTLRLVLLVTDGYLCEVPIAGTQGRSEFEVVPKSTVRGYRFMMWTHEVKEGEVVKASYQVAQVNIFHDISGGARTDLSYAGSDPAERAAWLKQVLEAIPFRLIL